MKGMKNAIQEGVDVLEQSQGKIGVPVVGQPISGNQVVQKVESGQATVVFDKEYDNFQHMSKEKQKVSESKNMGNIQEQRINEIVSIFNKSNSTNSLTINGKTIPIGNNPLKSKTTKILDSQSLTDDEIKNYAQQLAGNVQLVRSADGKVFTAKLDNNQYITLRDISSSTNNTGARWTIDISGNEKIGKAVHSTKPAKKVEIKFR